MLAMMHPMHAFPTLIDEVFEASLAPALSMRAPRPKCTEREESYEVVVSAPGVRGEDLDISVENGLLKVKGATQSHRHQTHVCNWAVQLPRDADTENATVSHADGILILCLPKKAADEKVVPVSTTDADASVCNDESSNSSYKLTLSLPGLAAADLEITVSLVEGTLKLKGETQRTGARVDRSYELPHNADLMNARAAHIDGLLKLTVPIKPVETTKIVVGTPESSPETMPETDKDMVMA